MAIFLTEDGSHSIYSEQFGVAYHSTHGAIQETKHVFIDAGLNHFIAQREFKQIKILEIGFGTGLNVFMTFLESHFRGIQIDFTTTEIYPLSISTAAELNYPQLLNVPHLGNIFNTFHTSNWNEKHRISDNFLFEKRLVDFQNMDFFNEFDIVYYDAFSPESQPELWDIEMLKRTYNALKEGGILTTYCAKGSFKRALKTVGFQIENIAGPPGKREMTRASKILK